MNKRQQPNLAIALADSAGSIRNRPAPPVEENLQQPTKAHKGTKPITVHFPPHVRNQLRVIAGEQGRALQYIIAEAYNDLFAKYGKPEIAPKENSPREY